MNKENNRKNSKSKNSNKEQSYELSRSINQMKNKYIEFKINGRLFPSWVLANFREYKLPMIIRQEGEDPCNIKVKDKLWQYQVFLSKYLDYRSPYRDLLIYHGLGSGKTASAINIYNSLYNYNPNWNVFILIKAALRDHPWMTDLEKWLEKDEKEFRMNNITFVHYDSPFADRDFLDAVKKSDSSKKNLFIIEEAHNFIRNVYSNITSQAGKRAQTIYDYIIQDKKENEGTRVIALSATPAINVPFEIALLFNLFRPGTFPKSEMEFNNYFISSSVYETLNPRKKNQFQRRIMGLVSFYIGATPDVYATKKVQYVDVKMSEYQEEVYGYFEEVEEQIAKKSRGTSSTYKSYTRQACNFVFPQIDQRITGETRPRPNKFKITEREAEMLAEKNNKKIKLDKGSDKFTDVNKYQQVLDSFVNGFDNYLNERYLTDEKNKYTIEDDFKLFKEKYNGNFDEFNNGTEKKSGLYQAMYMCSPKMVLIIFNVKLSLGPTLVYSNYVLMEGLQIFKIYLKYFGFNSCMKDEPRNDYKGYVEFHGGISDKKDRSKALNLYNVKENIDGKVVKIIMISGAGAEGLSLLNVRQVHIMEPYWQEVRINQMQGRAIRMCSHKMLPIEDRHVDIFRYKSIRTKTDKWTADQQVEDVARSKVALIQSFLDAVKEVAIDCVLNKEHNKLEQDYKCFQFDEPSLFNKHIGPAYKVDLIDDEKMDTGSNSFNSQTLKVKVMSINAVTKLTEADIEGNFDVSEPQKYWYYSKNHTVYDYDLKFPLGKIMLDQDGVPVKIDKDTYVIDQMIPIPLIKMD